MLLASSTKRETSLTISGSCASTYTLLQASRHSVIWSYLQSGNQTTLHEDIKAVLPQLKLQDRDEPQFCVTYLGSKKVQLLFIISMFSIGGSGLEWRPLFATSVSPLSLLLLNCRFSRQKPDILFPNPTYWSTIFLLFRDYLEVKLALI